jgi:excisionase family DNA binding protein
MQQPWFQAAKSTPGFLDDLTDADGIAAAIDIHRWTVYRWAAQRRIPSVRVGRKLRFDLNEVIAALRGGKKVRRVLQGHQQARRLAGAVAAGGNPRHEAGKGEQGRGKKGRGAGGIAPTFMGDLDLSSVFHKKDGHTTPLNDEIVRTNPKSCDHDSGDNPSAIALHARNPTPATSVSTT